MGGGVERRKETKPKSWRGVDGWDGGRQHQQVTPACARHLWVPHSQKPMNLRRFQEQDTTGTQKVHQQHGWHVCKR